MPRAFPARSVRVLALCAAVVIGAVCPAAARASSATGPQRLIVQFAPGTSSVIARAAVLAAGASVLRVVPQVGMVAASVPRPLAKVVRAALAATPQVLSTQIDPIAHEDDVTFTDPLVGAQWGLLAIGAPEAWSVTTGSPNVVVAVVDTGVDLQQPDLQGHLVPGYDFVDNDATPQEGDVDFPHGTHVAGIIGAEADNGIGGVGVAPSTSIMPIRVLGPDGSGYYSDIVSGIVYAITHGAQVINLSLGGDQPSAVLDAAILLAQTDGIFVSCAAGNDGLTTLLYPAVYDGCFSVGAIDETATKASFSNSGPTLDLVAPGVDIVSTGTDDTFISGSGTSMATPFVSGTAALLAAQGMGAADIAERLRDTATDLGPAGRDDDYGWGLLDAGAALGGAATPVDPTLWEASAGLISTTPSPTRAPTSSTSAGAQSPTLAASTGPFTVRARISTRAGSARSCGATQARECSYRHGAAIYVTVTARGAGPTRIPLALTLRRLVRGHWRPLPVRRTSVRGNRVTVVRITGSGLPTGRLLLALTGTWGGRSHTLIASAHLRIR